MFWPIRLKRTRGLIDRQRRNRVLPNLSQLESRWLLSTYSVNDASDQPLYHGPGEVPGETADGTITLRSAIQQVDLDGTGTIDFVRAMTITPNSALPTVTVPAIINGTAVGEVVISGNSTTGASGLNFTAGDSEAENLVINHYHGGAGAGIAMSGNDNELLDDYLGTDATGMATAGPNGAVGVSITGSGNTVSGCVISGNGGGGIVIEGSDNLLIGNDVGVNLGGTAVVTNGGGGIYLSGSSNTVGGTASGDANVVSGNGHSGIDIDGPACLVEGNSIGTNSAGTSAFGNGGTYTGNGYGIYVAGAGSNAQIGGTATGAGNTISGNYGAGILIQASCLVLGNVIGTNDAGATDLGNIGDGIDVGASGVTVGGSSVGEGNVISGNTDQGISLSGSGASGNLITGNDIGTGATGSGALGNGGDGVVVYGGASNNTIGGTTAGSANLIAYNDANGVQVGLSTTDNSVDNAILGNSIFANANLGIDLGNESSPTATPVGSPPSGPNNLQNAPIVTYALNSGAATTITGTLSSTPNTAFHVEFFSNPASTSQGKTYLGFVSVTTNGSGQALLSFSPQALVPIGLNITATATDPNGNTSEFSASTTVAAAPTNITNELSIKYGGFVYSRKTGLFTQSVTITNTSGAAITGPIEMLLQNLNNATLVNQTGVYQGSPYITILSSGSLNAGQSLTFSLVFADPTLQSISYTAEFLAGVIPPQG